MRLEDLHNLDRDEAAARWLTLAAAGSMGRADRRAFRDWLSCDQKNLIAMQRASTVWRTMDLLKRDAVIQAELTRARNVRWAMSKPTTRPWGLVTGAVAASLVVVVGLSSVSPQAAQAYEAPLGQPRQAVLSDGTVVDLNSGSRIEVRYGWVRRSVRLVRGEAQFSVKRSIKPFVVSVNTMEVAGGQSRFLIRDLGTKTSFLLVEGAVKLNLPGTQSGTAAVAGRLTTFDPARSVITAQAVEPADYSAWLDGRIVFSQTTVAEAALEFERYHPIRIGLTDDVRNLKISGAYRTRDLTPFLNALTHVHAVKWSMASPGVVLIEATTVTSPEK